jgi:hypothetical protein
MNLSELPANFAPLVHRIVEAGPQFEPYTSPTSEASIFKGIPMEYRTHPQILAMEGAGARVRYRGPRTNGTRDHCRKTDATHFSIYVRNYPTTYWNC